MKLKTTLLATALTLFALPVLAQDIQIVDGYARASAMMSKSGAAFMVIENHGAADDRLVAAASDVAEQVELHTHKEDANGVMQMIKVEEGFVIPAHGSHALARGGDHVMLMGLTRPLNDGDTVALTLTFEKAGEVQVDIPVDLERKDSPMLGEGMGAGQGHGAHMQHGQPAN